MIEQMVITTLHLNTAIRALGQVEFDLAGLNAYLKLDNGALWSELLDHEDRLVEIRDTLIEMQAGLREDARKDFAGRTDRTEEEE